jgi:hypothetical protein
MSPSAISQHGAAQFQAEADNFFGVRAIEMNSLVRRINRPSPGTEQLLCHAAEKMDAAEAALISQSQNEGLSPDSDENEEPEG